MLSENTVMKKVLLKILLISLIAIITSTCLLGCFTQVSATYDLFFEEDVFAGVLRNKASGDEDESYWTGLDSEADVWILGLSDEGRKKRAIEIPSTMMGYPVTRIGSYPDAHVIVDNDNLKENVKKASFSSDNLEVVYVQGWQDKALLDCTIDCPKFKRLVVNNKDKAVMQDGLVYYMREVVLPDDFNQYWLSGVNCYNYYFNNLYVANVEYKYNYGDIADENYKIDMIRFKDDHLYAFDVPEREGYVFDGWYLEKECINRWDGDTSVLFSAGGEQVIYIQNEALTVETFNANNQILSKNNVFVPSNILRLYAKWV